MSEHPQTQDTLAPPASASVSSPAEQTPAVVQRLRADRGALLDLAAWAGVAADQSTDDGAILDEILACEKQSLVALSTRGLRLLARLRGVGRSESASRRELTRRLRRTKSWRDSWRKRRRRVMASVLGRLLTSESASTGDAKREPVDSGGIRERVKADGVIAGIAGEIRGAADDYLAQKLDQIEQRVDRKLDQIDQRLAEWRDREVATRLRMLKFTLIAAILVALISLGYDHLKPAAADTGRGASVEQVTR